MSRLERRLEELEQRLPPERRSRRMRIAVCPPQVPFERGGTEILAESLVDELRRRDHEVELVTDPVQVVPGRHGAHARRSSGACSTSRRRRSGPIDLVIATKFPSYAIRHPNKVVWLVHQFRQAYELDGTELGQFGDDPRRPGDASVAIHRLDRTTLGEARGLFAISKNVAERLRALDGARGRGAPPSSAQHLDYRCDGVRGVHPLGGPPRPREAGRPPARGGCAGRRPRGRRGRRRARPRPPRALSGELGLDGRVRFAGRVGDDELVDLYARCLAVYYAPIDEDFGLVPYEAFLSEKPVVTTRGRGRAARGRHRRRERASSASRPRATLPQRCSWLAATSRPGTRLRARRQAARRADHLGRASSIACFAREGRLLLTASARALGHRRLQRAVASRARAAARRRSRPAGRRRSRRAAPTSPSTTSETTPTRTAGSSTRSTAAAGSLCCTTSCSTTSSQGSRSGAATRRATCDAMQRDAGVVGRLLAHGVVDGLLPPIWEVRPRTSRSRGRSSTRRTV